MTRAVIVGSGPNGLAAALTLAGAGVDVLVLEAAATAGGGLRSAALTLPGLLHDECSAVHPLAVATPFAQRFDLSAHGLTWRWPEVQYAHPLDGGGGAAAVRSVEETAAGLGADGPRWASLFGGLARDFAGLAGDLLRPALQVPRHPVRLSMLGVHAVTPATVLARRWSAPEARALFGGVAAHALRPLTSVTSSAIGVVLATAAHGCGWPVAEGGSGAIARAMVAMLRRLGGRIETGVRVDSLDELGSPDIVMLDVAPAAAARIAGERMPPRIARALTRYRHGPGVFKLDLAVEGGIPWTYEPARRAGTVHLGGDLREIAHAEALVHRGRMPDQPFVLVCQQYLADPSRSRGDVHPVYAYAHVPAGFTGDATARIEARIERFAPGFRDRVLTRSRRSPSEMEEHNANLVGGDVVGGRNDTLQLLFRPRLALDPYTTGIPGVYLCSAATPPGAGAHGMCGYNAATSALRRLVTPEAAERGRPGSRVPSRGAGRSRARAAGSRRSTPGWSRPA
jgi:phytoene dehydrogenase-like protein